MAISANTPISIQNLKDTFTTNIKNLAVSAGKYHSSSIPYFSGTSYSAVPTADMDSSSSINVTLPISANEVCSASAVYNNLISMTKKLTKVHNFSSSAYVSYSRWGTSGNSSWKSLAKTLSGSVILKDTLPAVTSGYTRSYVDGTNSLTNVTTTQKIISGSNMSASTMTTFLNQLKSAWETAKAKTVTYTFTYCHNSCHSNCHDSRTRR